MCFLVAWQPTWNTVPATTVSPNIHFHIHRPFPELILKLLELTSSAVFARRSAFRTIDKRPSSTREKPVLSVSLISKSASKKYLAYFISSSWDIYRPFQISLGATTMELKTKKKHYFCDYNHDGNNQDWILGIWKMEHPKRLLYEEKCSFILVSSKVE